MRLTSKHAVLKSLICILKIQYNSQWLRCFLKRKSNLFI